MAKNKHQTLSYNHRAFYRQPLFYLLIIALLATGAYLLFRKPKDPTLNDSLTSNTAETKPSSNTSDTTTTASTAPTETNNSSTTDPSVSPDGKTPEKYEGADPNTSESLTGYITTARFSGDKLVIRVNIDQYLSSGACTLLLTDGSNQLEKSTKLSPAASTSTCEGFDVQASELSNFSRPINITINLTSGDKRGSITGRVE